MASTFIKTLLWPVSRLVSDDTAISVVRRLVGGLPKELAGEVTDKFLELLLEGMDLGFRLSPDFRENLWGFRGRYVFRTADGAVAVSAGFQNGDMKVHKEAIPDWNVMVTFKNPQALWSFLFSKNQDILDSLLKNEVEVDGNLNCIYKFGFMARELTSRLGIEQ
jgi:hypothetical protein